MPSCDFKKKEYEKLFHEINYSVEFIYVFNDWFVGNVRIRKLTETPEASALTAGMHGSVRIVYVDLRRILAGALLAALAVFLVSSIIHIAFGIAFSPKARKRRRLRRQKKETLGHR